MKLIAATSLAVAAASFSTEWEAFKAEHGKSYNAVEEARRFNIFSDNLRFVKEHNSKYNAGEVTYHVAINKFADLSNSEFHAQYLGATQSEETMTQNKKYRLNYTCPVNFAASGNPIPAAVDWTDASNNPLSKVAVTHVKDQGSCGSCWSFGTTGTFEGAHCIADNQDCSTWNGASEQELVDCDGSDFTPVGNYYDMACNGGWIDNGLYYIIKNGGIMTEDSYAYVSGQTKKNGPCVSTTDPANQAGTISNCGETKSKDEGDLAAGIAEQGPMGVAINASGTGFQLYSGGVYVNDRCGTSVNHAVLAAGYGTDSASGYDFFLVKNSWGTGWGDAGFIKMRRNYNNMCSIASYASYGIV